MSEDLPRLKAEIWVKAYMRRCAVEGVPAFVTRRGDETAGVVLIKINTLDGRAQVLSPARKGDGTRVWMRRPGPEPVTDAEAESYIARQVSFDSDLWVVEIEDREGRHFLDDVEEPPAV